MENKYEYCDWRIGSLIHLKSMLSSEGTTDAFEDMCDPDYMEDLLFDLPFLEEYLEARPQDVMLAFLEKHYEGYKFGYILRAEVQSPTYLKKDDESYHSYGWGISNSRWLYAETIEDAENKAFNFRNEIHEIAKREAKK